METGSLIEQAIEAVKKTITLYKVAPDAEIEFVCPRGVQDKITLRSDDGLWSAVGVRFSCPPDYAFFTGLREILGDKYGAQGIYLANLLAVDFNPERWRPTDYDALLQEIFKDIKMVSLADPDNGTRYDTNVPGLVERWGINHTNLSPYSNARRNLDISPDEGGFVAMGDAKNPRDADFVWACNVVSFPAVGGFGLSLMDKQTQVYQTFAALVEMAKPVTGKLLLVSTLDKTTHYSIECDYIFHDRMGLDGDQLGSSRFSLFTRTEDKTMTGLELAKHVTAQKERLLTWATLG